jgi:D-alanyl-D-alanine carboxypeptidase
MELVRARHIIIFLILSLQYGDIFATEVEILASKPEEEIVTTLPILPSLFSQWSDEDIDAFTTRYSGLQDPRYIPPGLSPISTVRDVAEAGRVGNLRWEAVYGLTWLAWAFFEEFDTPLVVISWYRSAEYQQRLWDLWKCNSILCAPPGYSEHQLGLAIDLFDATTASEYYKNPRYRAYIAWLQEYAHLYGWHQSYQSGEYIDAYEVEPWHWRYLGVGLATQLKTLDMSYTEYIRLERTLEFWKR